MIGEGWESNPHLYSHNIKFCLLNYPQIKHPGGWRYRSSSRRLMRPCSYLAYPPNPCSRTWTYKPYGHRFWICCVYLSAIQAIAPRRNRTFNLLLIKQTLYHLAIGFSIPLITYRGDWNWTNIFYTQNKRTAIMLHPK